MISAAFLPSALLLQDRLIIVFIALAVHMVLFSPAVPSLIPDICRPLYWLRTLLRATERKMNREHRSTATRRWRGMLLCVFLLAVAVYVANVLTFFQASLRDSGFVHGWIFDVLLLAALMRSRSLFAAIQRLQQQEQDKAPLTAKRQTIAAVSPYNVAQLDAFCLRRQLQEQTVLAFGLWLVAPATAYVLCGLHGAVVMLVILQLCESYYYPHPRYYAYSSAMRPVLNMVLWLPMLCATFLLVLSGLFFTEAKPAVALRAWCGQWGNRVDNWLLAVQAGLFGMQLGGKKRFNSLAIPAPWYGYGTARIGTEATARLQRQMVLLHLLYVALLGCAYLALRVM